MLEECIGRFLTIKPYQNAVSIFNVIIPDGSHIQYVLNEGAAELAKICICHVVGHPKNANERVPSNLKQNYSRFKHIIPVKKRNRCNQAEE
jgi:hypothetical protein